MDRGKAEAPKRVLSVNVRLEISIGNFLSIIRNVPKTFPDKVSDLLADYSVPHVAAQTTYTQYRSRFEALA